MSYILLSGTPRCQACRKDISKTDRHCPHCGVKVRKVTPAAATVLVLLTVVLTLLIGVPIAGYLIYVLMK